MALLDNIDWSDRKTQLAVGGVGVVAILAIRGIRGSGPTVNETAVGDSYGTRSDGDGVVGWVGNANPAAPAPTPAAPESDKGSGKGRGLRPREGSPSTSSPTEQAAIVAAIDRNSTANVMQTMQPPGGGVSTSGGRVAGLQDVDGGATYRDTPATGEKMRTYPEKNMRDAPAAKSDKSGGKSSAIAKAKPKTTGAAKGRGLVAAAGEGILDDVDDVNPREWGAFANTVGGFDPNPAPVAATVAAEVREGESLVDLSSRLYGTRGHAARLLAMNPDLLVNTLQAGDRVRVM